MEKIIIDSYEFRVKRSSRRTVGIRAAKDGTAEILSPKYVSLSELKKITLPYVQKIQADCRKIKELSAKRERFRIGYGDSVRLLGKWVEVRAGDKNVPLFGSEAVYIPPKLDFSEMRCEIIVAYKKFAKEYLLERTMELAKKMNLKPDSIKVNSATTHWGSCGRNGRINFSWVSVMASEDAVDYIIVHELCHMRHFNHSREFYCEVEKYCPDYKMQIAYLRECWREISAEGWI